MLDCEYDDDLFACCGESPEISVIALRGGVGVTAQLGIVPVIKGVTGVWAIKKSLADLSHSFVVVSFLEETMVLSIGVDYFDVTDKVGFDSGVRTLACGLVLDGLLVQVHKDAVNIVPDWEFDIIVVGTLKPSIEVLSFTSDKSPRAIAIGNLTVETSIFSSAPQDVRLVLGVGDRPYVLSGLKNGMLLRFEWPSASSLDEDFTLNLKLVCSRKLGSRPAFLVPLSPSPDANVIALGDRPHMSCSSICFPPSTHATPICSAELPMAVIADDRYHLVEIPHCNTKEETYKKFSLDPFSPSFQKFKIGGTPKKILYHSSNSLLLILRTNLNDVCSSDVCCMDPLSGSLLASFRFNQDETGNSMELVEIGAEHVLVVGTSSSNSVQGRVLVFRLEQMQTMERASTRYSSREQLNEACSLKLVCSETWEGRIEICGLLDHYFVASCATEDLKKLRPTDFPPCHGRELTDCLMGEGTAIVSDENESLAILSNLTQPRGSTTNMVKSSFFMGEKAIRILKGSFSGKVSVEGPARVNFMASTEKGSIIEFIPLTREEYELLNVLQDRLGTHFLTAPILGQSLVEYHSSNNWPSSLKILDGDMLSQFFQLARVARQFLWHKAIF